MTNDSRPPDDLNSSAAPVPPTRPERRVSGRAMVLGMLAFGTLTTAAMWVYWTLHVGPFRPLQDAIAAAFPHSSPRVDGGQRKMHKGTPKILRIVMRVDFDPVVETSRGEASRHRGRADCRQAPRSESVRRVRRLSLPGRSRAEREAARIHADAAAGRNVDENGEGFPEYATVTRHRLDLSPPRP